MLLEQVRKEMMNKHHECEDLRTQVRAPLSRFCSVSFVCLFVYFFSDQCAEKEMCFNISWIVII